MSDVFNKLQRSKVMAAVRSRGNKATELKLVQILRSAGITGWRRHPSLSARPDFVFRRERLAIFVDGCFWHGCRRHCRMPKTNSDYWREKIARNSLRDRASTKSLKLSGWRVLRIWGHALGDQDFVIRRITSQLSRTAKKYKNTLNRK